jgi:hypothetical protein
MDRSYDRMDRAPCVVATKLARVRDSAAMSVSPLCDYRPPDQAYRTRQLDQED